MSEEEKKTLQELLGDISAYYPDILLAGDGSFRWARGAYCSPYEVLKGIHDAKFRIDKLGMAIEAIEATGKVEK